jgi:hypothetical protein
MTKTKKSRGRAKAETKHEAKIETGPRAQVVEVAHRVQEGLREAGDALREARDTMGHESRKVALKLVSFSQDNVLKGFETLRDTLQAESFAEAVKIQQHAITDMFRRSLRQIREVSEIVGESGNKSLKPISKLVTSLRDARKAA